MEVARLGVVNGERQREASEREREREGRKRMERWRCSQVEIRSCLMIVPEYMTRVEVNGSACPTPR